MANELLVVLITSGEEGNVQVWEPCLEALLGCEDLEPHWKKCGYFELWKQASAALGKSAWLADLLGID